MSQMDAYPSPLPGRIRKSKYMDYRKTAEESKSDCAHHRNMKQKRIFGTQRNTNVPVKSNEKKPAAKSRVEMSRKQQKSSKVIGNEKPEATQKAVGLKDEATDNDEGSKPRAAENDDGSKHRVTEKDEGSKPIDAVKDEGSNPGRVEKEGVKSEAVDKGERLKKAEGKPTGEAELVKPKKKKKSVEFQNKVDEDLSAPQTPLVLTSSVLRKPRRSATPYHTARNCSRCRFDKLESSSYWTGQIKLAESVGKHFVSVAFFQLAHECNAEPVRSLKIELKKYLSRHGHLGKQKEWIEAARNYGLVVVAEDEDRSSSVKVDSKDQPNPETDSNSNVVTGSRDTGRSNTA